MSMISGRSLCCTASARALAALPLAALSLAVLSLAVLLLAGCVNFHTVEEGKLYRVSQPEEYDLARWIWRYRLQTVVRLRGGEPGSVDFDASFRPTQAAGIDFVQLPMSARRYPTKQELVALCELFETARYPILVHCQAGADRTGLACAVYAMHRWGDLERARGQLSLRYLHVGWPSTGVLDEVLDLYEPFQHKMTFGEWARQVYQPPAPAE